ncbi:conjugal transfer protein [Priestia megaterium]|uniref:conjugal transfer protein n=1 Tax=Priestia megaterium TaxID=1404 RepID=UPI0023644C8A|nr:conjugal transfer protein [Priestia megaterium]MDD1516227.1 conjugal transfer protein [Priestia megaterium]
MRKWQKKKKPAPNEPSQGTKEKARQKASASKKYMPNLLKKDEKQKEKDQVMIKRASMKRSTATTIGRVIMIGSIVIVALGVFNAFRHNLVLSDLEDRVSAQKQDNSPKNNQNTQNIASVEYFTTQFMRHYTSIEPGDDKQKAREEALQSFLATGLDKDAGIDYANVPGTQRYDSSDVVSIKQKDERTSDVSIKVNVTSVKEVEKKSKDKDGKEKVEKKNEEKKATLYYLVRLYEGKNGYSVIDLPQPYMPKQNQRVTVSENEENKNTDAVVNNEVQRFLESFFKTYTAKDRSDETKFFFKDSSKAQSLNGLMNYKSLNNVSVYEKKSTKDQYIVRCSVKLEQPVTGIQSNHSYEFVIQRDGQDKFEILTMKPVSYEIK